MNRIAALILAGWLADSLAGPDSEVEAAVEAYRAAEYEEALARLDAAEVEHGERPELRYNRGLVLAAQGKLDEARKAFERGTESEEINVRASSAYELGNLDFDAESYQAAIDRYIECLKADPTHQKAKWNLEVAQWRLEEEEKNKEDEDSEGDGDGDQEEGGDGDQESEDDGGDGDGDGDETGGSEESSDSGDGDGDGDGDEGGGEETGGEETGGDEQQGDEQKGDEQKGDEQEGDAQPQPIQRADLSQALEDLDQQDNFMLGRPQGGGKKKVERDW